MNAQADTSPKAQSLWIAYEALSALALEHDDKNEFINQCVDDALDAYEAEIAKEESND